MKIDYLYRHKEFKKVLEKELDRLIKGEINQIRIKNIPSDVFCEATGCETNDFNGWQCDWWDISSIKDISSAFAVAPGMERLA